ncbi:hypothetical protein C2G38_2185567 [Gigaspora rosea]|uniref:Uncharacterized protein n=1 Tax=Gigaspora rosea TaxID=44941 RepID=A0A397V6I9_9GLOM|nr:hypothetical protein C2G38_2185567 [Gigaspora rosea]
MERSETVNANETENANLLSFSKVVKVMTNILYIHQNRTEPTIYTFEEFRAVMERKNASIHMKCMPNTITTSTATHMATILINLINNQTAILKSNLHNPALDAELIKMNIEDKFMMFYGLSHNHRWGFRTVSDDTRLDKLIVHSYDIRLKKKCHIRSLKDVVLVDLQENGLYLMEEYIKAIKCNCKSSIYVMIH